MGEYPNWEKEQAVNLLSSRLGEFDSHLPHLSGSVLGLSPWQPQVTLRWAGGPGWRVPLKHGKWGLLTSHLPLCTVANWYGNRLLTDQMWVRVPPVQLSGGGGEHTKAMRLAKARRERVRLPSAPQRRWFWNEFVYDTSAYLPVASKRCEVCKSTEAKMLFV